MKIKDIATCALDVLLPRQCPVCGAVLGLDERYLCRRCLAGLPLTHLHEVEFNAMEQLFAGLVPFCRATAYFYYEKGSPYAQVIHDIKYNNMPRMGQWLGSRAARDIAAASQFWQGVDCLVPVPLHRDKLAKRGYNQSQHIAKGISDYCNIPVIDALVAARSHSTLTRKGKFERSQATLGIYQAKRGIKAKLQGKHVALVDDVATTGSTLLACATALASVPRLTISFFSLALDRLE